MMRYLLLSFIFLCALAMAPNPNLEVAGNIYMVGERPFESPTKIFMGPDHDRGLYVVVQQRPDGSLFYALETFCRPANGVAVAEGYGCGAIRLWGDNVLVEEDGTAVFGGDVVTNKIVLQEPTTDNFGGITWDKDDLGTYLTRDGDNVILYSNGKEVARW